MTKLKENGEASKETSDSIAADKDTEMVEEDKEEVKITEVEEKEQMSEEQEIEEEDREEEQDEDEVNDQSTNVYMRSKRQVGTSNVDKEAANGDDVNRVEDNDNCDEMQEEDPVNLKDDEDMKEDDKPNDSDHNDVEMHSNIPDPEISVDDGQLNEKSHTENEQASVGADDKQHLDAMSKDSDYVKFERGITDNGCTSGSHAGRDATCDGSSAMDDKNPREVKDEENMKEMTLVVDDVEKVKDVPMGMESTEQNQLFMFDDASEGGEAGTEEEQLAFMKELENLFREKGMEFKAPKFYGEPLNLLKLWRAVIKLGGYDKVTACKLWRQVGESFNPPKTCTTVSWTFRIFYEKALLEYERHKISGGELHIPQTVAEPVSMESPAANNQASGSGRARRDAAARAMQGWHSQRLLGNGEVGDPIIKDKSPVPLKSREKQLKNIGGQKRKKPLAEAAIKAPRTKLIQESPETAVIDVGPPADWVKINVRTTKDCYEVYALVPGLLREEVRVQSDPAGRLVISGEPENADNPWGVTAFRKVISLPSRIDPHQTSAVVTLHGQLFVRVPFEQSD